MAHAPTENWRKITRDDRAKSQSGHARPGRAGLASPAGIEAGADAPAAGSAPAADYLSDGSPLGSFPATEATRTDTD